MTMLAAPLFLAAGCLTGAAFFALLRWNTTVYLRGGSAVMAGAVHLFRLAAMGMVLAAAARQGALPLLLTALGVLIARALVVRRGVAGAA
jgi:hypothetical protein